MRCSSLLLMLSLLASTAGFTLTGHAAASSSAVAMQKKAMSPVMLPSRKPRQPSKGKPAGKRDGLDSTVPSLIYYGVYTLVFGKMALVLLERALGAG